ncbi:MAG: class I SAM-dependent methyltransferase [Syntrophobacterales bacterium]|jgi:methyltransferase (TIGR00027 family)|nr:class I SAM-dependent methyltransferase [Syntrophobacterales bacterium]
MEPNKVSLTAMGTAFMRAYHAAHDRPKIFDDSLAQHLITEEERQASEERHLRALHLFDPERAAACPDRASALAGWMQSAAAPPIVLGRAKYAEDFLEQAVSQGVKQYVILGAGMDTFAWRRPDLLAQLHVFEVDHPATQAHKRQRLMEAGRGHPPQVQFIEADFSQENLAAALRRSAYDPQAPTFFSWLGVSYYLTREAVLALWRAIGEVGAAGSSVIFDYLDTDAFVPEKASRRVQFMMEIVRRVGEPMITGFDPSALAADMAGVGLRLEENLSPEDIQGRFFEGRADGYRATEHAYFALAVVA